MAGKTHVHAALPSVAAGAAARRGLAEPTRAEQPARDRLPDPGARASMGTALAPANPASAHRFAQVRVRPPLALPLQAKLAVSEPGDQHEQEADRVADEVIRMATPEPPEAPADETPQEGALQRRPMAETVTPLVQPQHGENQSTCEFADQVARLQAGGEALPAAVRAFFEPRFGHDFAEVRVHADPAAADSARAMHAAAYTVGMHIVFGGSQYAPDTAAGRHLLAHELTHVLQQKGHRASAGAMVQRRTVRESFATAGTETGPVRDVVLTILQAPEEDTEELQDFLDAAQEGIRNAAESLDRMRAAARASIRVSLRYRPGFDYAEVSSQAFDLMITAVLGPRREQVREQAPPPERQVRPPVIESPSPPPRWTRPPEPVGSLRFRIAAIPERHPLLRGTTVRYGVMAEQSAYVAPDSPRPHVVGRWSATRPSGLDVELGTDEQIELTPDVAGRWTIRVRYEVPGEATYLLEYPHDVVERWTLAEEAIDENPPSDFMTLRIRLEQERLERSRFAEWAEVNASRTPPYIDSGNPNPAGANTDPDRVYHRYVLHPTGQSRRYRWYVRQEPFQNVGSISYQRAHAGQTSFDVPADITFEQRQIDGDNAWVRPGELDTSFTAFRFIVVYPGRYTITADELDEHGQPSGRTAQYVQIVLPDSEYRQLHALTRHIERVDQRIERIPEGQEIALGAAYVNAETGLTMPLSMYMGPDAENPGEVILLDLTPGVSRVEYEGSDAQHAFDTFESGNAYPVGLVRVEVPPNQAGIAQTVREFPTTGASTWAAWSSGTGWASLGLGVAGVIAGLIPGGQPVAAVLFIAAAGTGVVSGSLSLYDRLQQAEVSATMVAVDILGIVSSIVGGASAFRALRLGHAVNLATRTGRFLLYTGFATDAVAGVLMTVEGVDQISRILESDMPRGEQTGAIVRILAGLILQGGLVILSARQLGEIRARIGGHLGEEVQRRLSADVVHTLNLLDDDALRALRGVDAQGLERIAGMVRLNRDVANRLARLQGANLAAHSMESAEGLVRLNGEIDLHPSSIASLSDDQLREIMAASLDLRAHGGVRERTSAQTQAALDRLTASGGARLRFGYQLRQAEQFIDAILRDLRMENDPLARRLFGSMDFGDRARLFELMNRPHSRQAAHYALSTRPTSVREFANRFEFYVGQLEQLAEELEDRCIAEYRNRVVRFQHATGEAPNAQETQALQQDVTQDLLGAAVDGVPTRGRSFRRAAAAQAERQMAQAGDPSRTSEAARAAVDVAYEQYAAQIRGRTGAQRINPRITDAELPAAVRAVPEVRFSSESAAAYHVQKHTTELPPSERPAGRTDGQSYLDSVQLTIQHGQVQASTSQTGARSLSFVRVVDEGGQRYTMRAIVYVGMDGNVVVATYGGSHRPIPRP